MRQNKTRVLGLTGSIASGKSTASHFFREQGYQIVDCDEVARTLTDEKEIIGRIAETFGRDILLSSGKIDRKKLGSIVFSHEAEKQKLDNLLKCPLREAILGAIKEAVTFSTKDFIILDCPLLFESGLDKVCDRTLCIHISRDLQLKRLMERNQIDKEFAELMISAQLSSDDKVKRADDVIENNKDISALKEEVSQFIRTVLNAKSK